MPEKEKKYKFFKVVRITSNIENNPECETDTIQHPLLIEELVDEMDVFILNQFDYREFYRADDFFYSIDLDSKFKIIN